jgi:hypothetical protein
MTTSRFATIGILWTLGIASAWGQGGFGGPGRYQITNLKSGKVLDLDRNDQTTVIQFSSRGTDNQQWDIQPSEQGFWVIRNAMNGKALEATGNSNSAPLVCGRFDGRENQQWRIEPGKDGNALIVSRFGKSIDVPDGSSRDGLHLQIYDSNGDSNQRFTLQRVGGGGPRGPEVLRRPDGDREGRGPRPDRYGRYFDDREQAWRLEGDGVCFYEQRDFRGNAWCARQGEDFRQLPPDFGAAFISVRFFGRARSVTVFERRDFRGERYRIARDERNIERERPRWISGRVGSIQID